MKLAVIGTGYVGLVAGTCFADNGANVICVDILEEKVKMLREGKAPIYEPGLEDLIVRNIEEQRLEFSTDLAEAVKRSNIIFIAVGTPSGEDGSADLTHVIAAAEQIGRAMDGYRIIVVKSTVPVGSCRKVAAAVASVTDHEFDVVSNPEFLKEGAAIEDFLKPDRVVIGSQSERAVKTMQELYEPFVRTGKPILTMDLESAEMTKYASNAMLATKISFINELAALCERVGADVETVRKGIGFDARIGFSFLFPGVGFGGSCFPKDIRALINVGDRNGFPMKLLQAVEEVNERQKKFLAEKTLRYFDGDLTGKKIAIWGLSFKPRTDDIREAPAQVIMQMLLDAGAKLAAHDPEASENMQKVFPDCEYCKTSYEALADADALLIVTEWNEFRRPDFDRMKSLMKKAVIFDGRNIYDPKRMDEHGIEYYAIGRARKE